MFTWLKRSGSVVHPHIPAHQNGQQIFEMAVMPAARARNEEQAAVEGLLDVQVHYGDFLREGSPADIRKALADVRALKAQQPQQVAAEESWLRRLWRAVWCPN